MCCNGRNIYKNARQSAGLTQERAAEMLGTSVESIRAYETGGRVPPSEMVELMVICYNAQFLAYQHIRASANMARSIIPDIKESTLLEASARLTNRIYAFADNHLDRRLMQIAEDNCISAAERQEFDAIAQDLAEIVEAALALRYAQGNEH